MEKLIKITTSAFLFLLPLFFIPSKISVSSDYEKDLLLVFFTGILFILLLVQSFIRKKIVVKRSSLDFLLLSFVVLIITSTLLFSPNKLHAFTSPMGAGTVIFAIVLFFSLSQIKFSLLPLVLGSAVTSLFIILKQIGLFPDLDMNPLGNHFYSSFFLSGIILFVFAEIIFSRLKKDKDTAKKSALAKSSLFINLFSFVLMLSAGTISLYHLFTDQKPILLPFAFGWAIMMEAYKNFLSFLFGVGPGNFSSVYNFGKTAAINSTSLWNLNVSNSSSYFLTLATEGGVILAIIFALIFLRSLKSSSDLSDHISKSSLISLTVLLILQFLLPSTVIVLSLTIILLSVALPKKEKEYHLPSFYPYLSIIFILAILGIFFFETKSYMANFTYRRAITAAQDKKLGEAYVLAQQAESIDPETDYYYNLSSNLGMTLANNLSQDKNSTESAQKITFLTQQAVRDAKMATEINPGNSNNWGQLAGVYEALAGSVKDAEKYSLDAYDKQIRLDPYSPIPKVSAGKFLLRLGQYDQAQNLLTQAVNLKSDWNAPYYNLAVLLAQTKKYKESAQAMQQTLNLTPNTSEDYKKIQEELEQIKKLIPPESTPSGEPNQPDKASAKPTKNVTPTVTNPAKISPPPSSPSSSLLNP